MFRIRAFRTTQDRESCERFAFGHEKVLRDFGVEKVTSANKSWMDNPDVYVLIVESLDGEVVYGGSRIHKRNAEFPLPVEDAVGEMDPNIYEMVQGDETFGAGEMCGLWNSKDARGTGISTVLTKATVAKAGVEIANLLGIKRLWVLCAPYTVGMVEEAGFRIVKSLGDQGTFPYPRPDLPATILRLDDADQLPTATDGNRTDIFDLRNKPVQKKVEIGPKGEIIVEYDLMIKNL